MRAILDQAMSLPEGESLVLDYPSHEHRERARWALFWTVRKARQDSRKAYNVSEPEWDTTPWDGLMITRQGRTQLALVRASDLQPVKVTKVSHARS